MILQPILPRTFLEEGKRERGWEGEELQPSLEWPLGKREGVRGTRGHMGRLVAAALAPAAAAFGVLLLDAASLEDASRILAV